MIVSASYRTDIPAYYGDWLISKQETDFSDAAQATRQPKMNEGDDWKDLVGDIDAFLERAGQIDFRRVAFEDRSTNPMYWVTQAEAFLVSSFLIRRYHVRAYKDLVKIDLDDVEKVRLAVIGVETFRPSLHLLAIGCELYLKSVLILKKHPELPESFSHRLTDLAKHVLDVVSEEEVLTLKRLERVIIWFGRYPKPKREKDYDFLSEDMPLDSLWDFFDAANSIVERCRKFYEPL